MRAVQPFKRCWRKINGMTIIFYSTDTIYLQQTNNSLSVYHCWWETRPYYKTNHWCPFARALKRSNKLDQLKINQLAAKHYVNVQFARKLPEDWGVQIPSHYTEKKEDE